MRNCFYFQNFWIREKNNFYENLEAKFFISYIKMKKIFFSILKEKLKKTVTMQDEYKLDKLIRSLNRSREIKELLSS